MDALRRTFATRVAIVTVSLTAAAWFLAHPSPLSSLGLLAALAFGLAAVFVSRDRSVAATARTLGQRADTLGTWAIGSAGVGALAAQTPQSQPLWVLIVPACVGLTLLTDAVAVAALLRNDDRRAAVRGLAKAALPTIAIVLVTLLAIAWILDPPEFTF